MFRKTFSWPLLLLCSANFPGLRAADLSTVPSDQLLAVYAKLRMLEGSGQYAIAENVVWKRDAATFTFRDGTLRFAAPVEGRVLAAVFAGRGTFDLDPPTGIDQRQVARMAKAPRLQDEFREATFLFTDNAWDELQKLVKVREGGDALVTGKALQSAQKRYAEHFNDWWGNQHKGSFAIRNLAARILADLSDPSSRGFFLAHLETERHGELFYHISWNRDPILRSGIATDEEVMLMRYKTGQYSEWWAGFHLREEYSRTSRPEHRKLLAHCLRERVVADVSKSNRVSATAEMEFEVPGGSARVLPMVLDGVLRISSVEDGEGKKLGFIQEARDLDSDPWLILPEPAVPGKVYRIRVSYEEDSTRDSRIIFQRGAGLYYVTSRASWFPNFGAFDDRTHFVMRMRSPKKYKFVGTGKLVKSEKGKDWLETEWQSEIPYSVIGFNYGDFVDRSQSDANLAVTAYAGKEVPDALKGFSSAIDLAELAGGSAGPRNIAGDLGVATGGFNTASHVGYAASVSYQALKLFEYYFGQLPFKTIAVTEQPVMGYGQSWPTLIFLPYDSLLDTTTRHQLRLTETADAREFYNTVAVHEMAHQWWGHLVGWKTYHDQWLSEGFAEFSAALYVLKTEPKKFKSFWDLKRDRLMQKNAAGHRPVEVGPLWLGAQLPAYLEPQLYQQLVYFKGAYVLEMLRKLMEDLRDKEPDGRFIRMMRDFTSAYAAKNPSTEDFRRVVEKHMGEPMDWFFHQWVYGTEIPAYNFSYEVKDAGGGKSLVRVSLTQSGVSDSFLMRIPIYVYVKGQARQLGLMQVRGSSTSTGEVTLPIVPEKVVADDTNSILCAMKQ